MRVLGIGGTLRPGSSSELALRIALHEAERQGADVQILTAAELVFPPYAPGRGTTPDGLDLYLEAVRMADALIISSPGYHGSVSGLLKNALDYLEELRDDERVYLDGVTVGCIAVAHGWQAAVATLQALRGIVHALRGWPTPFGAAINSAETTLAPDSVDERANQGLRLVGKQATAAVREHAVPGS